LVFLFLICSVLFFLNIEVFLTFIKYLLLYVIVKKKY
jgi:hypothetical protein